MAENNIFEHLQQLFNEFKGNLNIINEQINVKLQVEYFKFSEEIKKDMQTEEVLKNKYLLFQNDIDLDYKKRLLSQLASIDEVTAYRTIEKYIENPDESLKSWALLAFQESKMSLQSKLLEQNQLFISTGLGGKDNKLRYFIVLLSQNEVPFTDFHKKMITGEFDYIFQKSGAEIEELNFSDNLANITALIPINITLTELFSTAVNECNQYGNFIKDNGIITNVKILSLPEIKEFLKKNNSPNQIIQ
jgi:hypothetical protein